VTFNCSHKKSSLYKVKFWLTEVSRGFPVDLQRIMTASSKSVQYYCRIYQQIECFLGAFFLSSSPVGISSQQISSDELL